MSISLRTIFLISPLAHIAVIAPALADLQTVYTTVGNMEAEQQIELRDQSTNLGSGAAKTGYRLPEAYDHGNVVLKVCNDEPDCIAPELDDYATLAVDFENELVGYYPHAAANLENFPCADAEDQDCEFLVEDYINGPFKNVGNDFGTNQNVTNACQWAVGQEEQEFVDALNDAMNEPFGMNGYADLINAANAQSIGNISAVLTTTDYIFLDLQGGFTGQNDGPGFIISDTGVETHYTTGERNCQVNWLCSLATHLGGEDVCDFIQNLE